MLTDRQRRVLVLRSYGMSLTEIAIEMDLGVETVKTHMTNVIKHLQVKNSIHAVAVALREKIIQ